MPTQPSAVEHSEGNEGFLHPEALMPNFGIQRGWKVADFGCGSGYFTVLMAQAVGHEGRVWAFDVRSEALEAVRSRAKMLGFGNIECVRTNVEASGGSRAKDEAFDFVLLANMLFQSEKKEDILKEAIRTLKQNANFVVIDWKKQSGMGHHAKGWEFSSEEAQKMIEGLGLKVSLVKTFDAGKYHWGLLYKKTANNK